MQDSKYSPELRTQVIKDFEATGDAKLVAARHTIPEHAVYGLPREQLASPEVSKDKKIREITQELQKKDLENLIELPYMYLISHGLDGEPCMINFLRPF